MQSVTTTDSIEKVRESNMSIAFMCDKCGNVFESKKDLKRVVCANITSANGLMNKYDIQIDLCKNCRDELFDFINKESEEN